VNDLFLGVIAVATLAIAIAQIGVMVTAGLLAKRIGRLAEQLERDVKPLFGHLNAIGRDATRAASLATAQMERVDQLLADLVGRIDAVLNTLQDSIAAPLREGRALISGLQAAVQTIREMRRNARARQGRADDEDALFI
jgi:hypothetical protein